MQMVASAAGPGKTGPEATFFGFRCPVADSFGNPTPDPTESLLPTLSRLQPTRGGSSFEVRRRRSNISPAQRNLVGRGRKLTLMGFAVMSPDSVSVVRDRGRISEQPAFTSQMTYIRDQLLTQGAQSCR